MKVKNQAPGDHVRIQIHTKNNIDATKEREKKKKSKNKLEMSRIRKEKSKVNLKSNTEKKGM